MASQTTTPQQQYSELVNVLVNTQRDSLAAHKELVESHRLRLKELDAINVQLRIKNDNTTQRLGEAEARNTQLQRQVERLNAEIVELKSAAMPEQVIIYGSSESSDTTSAEPQVQEVQDNM